MSKSINNSLFNENFSTNFAVLTLGKSGFNASRLYSIIDYLGMSKSINNSLFNENFSTNFAVLTLGKSGFCASRCNCLVDYFGVTECRNTSLLKSFAAILADVCLKSAIKASRIFFNYCRKFRVQTMRTENRLCFNIGA